MCVGVLSASLWAPRAHAKNPEEPETAVPVGSDLDFLNHDKMGPFWLGAEVNSIFQTNPGFPAKYSGVNSFGVHSTDAAGRKVVTPSGDWAISGLATVFTAYRPLPFVELILDPEMA